MNLIPEEELKPSTHFNFAPMIDFLFLMLALFATLAISRATLFDTKIDLVESSPQKEQLPIHAQSEMHHINISVTAGGEYKWISEVHDYSLEGVDVLQQELYRQYGLGVIPRDKSKTLVLLHIDKEAQWDPIAKVIFAVREAGFEVHPIYKPFEPSKENSESL